MFGGKLAGNSVLSRCEKDRVCAQTDGALVGRARMSQRLAGAFCWTWGEHVKRVSVGCKIFGAFKSTP